MNSILKQALKSLSVGTISGLTGGLIAGVGSRLAMRLAGALTSASNRGIETEAGFTVGEITPDGTVFLILFSAYLGIFGGLAYVSVKPWIPSTGRTRGLWFGSLLLVLFGPLVIESANFDFNLFGPPLLNLVTFSCLFLLFGLVTTSVADRLDDGRPTARRTRWVRIPTESLTAGLILYVLVVLPLVRVVARQRVASDTEANGPPRPAVAGHIAFGLAVVVGAGLTAWEFVAILRAG